MLSNKKKFFEFSLIALSFLFLFYFLSERSITKFLNLKSGMDTGIFENILFNAVHGDFFHTYLGPYDLWHSYFSDHVNFFLFAILPFYYLFPKTETLFIMQSFFLSVPVVLLYLYSQNKIKYPIVPSLFYLFYLPVYWIGIFDIHLEVAFIPLFILFMIFWERRSFRWAIVLFVLCLFCKEEVAFVFVAFSFVIRKKEPKLSALIFCVSAAYFLIAIFVLSALSPDGGAPIHLVRYGSIPRNSYLFGHLIFFLFAPFLIFPFFSRYVLLALPYLAYSFLSSAEPNKTPLTHHSFVALPVLFTAFVCGYRSLRERWSKADWIALCGLFLSLYLFLSEGPPNKKYNYKENFIKGSVDSKSVEFLRAYDPKARMVSNIPAILSNRKQIRTLFLDKIYSPEETIVIYTGDHFADLDPKQFLKNHSQTHRLEKVSDRILLLKPMF